MSHVVPLRHAIITGTGSYVPARIVTNAELSARLGEDIAPFVSGTLGIHERRWTWRGSTCARTDRVQRFAVIDHEFTSEGGELTPTLKVVRRVVGERFASTFDALYAPEIT